MQNLEQQIHRRNPNPEDTNRNKNKKKMDSFTYYSPNVRKITNLFKHTNIGIAFKTTNNLQQLTNQK
jgi:hypothetical protein